MKVGGFESLQGCGSAVRQRKPAPAGKYGEDRRRLALPLPLCALIAQTVTLCRFSISLGTVAQLAERRSEKAEVGSSILPCATRLPPWRNWQRGRLLSGSVGVRIPPGALSWGCSVTSSAVGFYPQGEGASPPGPTSLWIRDVIGSVPGSYPGRGGSSPSGYTSAVRCLASLLATPIGVMAGNRASQQNHVRREHRRGVAQLVRAAVSKTASCVGSNPTTPAAGA